MLVTVNEPQRQMFLFSEHGIKKTVDAFKYGDCNRDKIVRLSLVFLLVARSGSP